MPGLIHQAAVERLRARYGDKLETRLFRKRLEEEMLKTKLYELCRHEDADKLHAEYLMEGAQEAQDDGNEFDPESLKDYHCEWCLSCVLRTVIGGRKPDAFIIEQSGTEGKDWEGKLTIFEVEDSHPTSADKLWVYIGLFWRVLDQEYWRPPSFVSVDRWGTETRHCLIYDIERSLQAASIGGKGL